ncbi:MarR family winged helix-turn-helix transcriptional regulator [Dactylosporangium sp. NPDC000521]|uniref:MarR family winged helix-turn-helix transcriptional regulator n=1 Tax=Dactylosporangium sp. NPDC000521 TaxID=3363975 RepID=UPI0036B132E9
MPEQKGTAAASLTQRAHRAAVTMRRHLEHEVLQPVQMTFTGYEILHTLREIGACTAVDIVRITGIRTSTVSEASARLIDEGLVIRRVDQRDARARLLQLTESGRRLIDRLVPAVSAVEVRILQELSAGVVTGAELLLAHLQPGGNGLTIETPRPPAPPVQSEGSPAAGR